MLNRISLFIVALLLCVCLDAKQVQTDEPGYTINFENVELKELLQFISKIGNLNLIYNESEIAFNISFVSDKPTSLENVKSALVQILRIKGLSLVEEGNNLIIHKNPDIKQIPAVVSAEHPLKGEMPAILTRVFKIHRGNPTSIAGILTPLLSKTSLIEVSTDTRQLIVTDVASSIETVQQLLKSLDVPNTPNDIEVYEAENMGVLELQIFAKKIMAPLAKGAQLEIIAQPDTNKIYIVSTPFLIDRTLSILEEIDKEIDLGSTGHQRLVLDNVLIYQLKHKSHDDVVQVLEKVLKESKDQGLDSSALHSMLEHSSYVSSAHSIVFVGLPANLALIQGLLKNIDVSNSFLGSENASFYLFEPNGMSIDDVMNILEEIAKNLKDNGYPDQSLLHVLTHSSPIFDLNAVLFVVPPDTKEELTTLLNSIIASYNVDISKTGISHFYLYNIKKASEEQMRDALTNLTKYLKNNDYPNENLIKTIESMKWIKASDSLFFVGNTKSLNELAEILPTLDVTPDKSQEKLTESPPPTEFIVFSPLHTNVNDLKSVIDETANELGSSDLSDPAFMNCLQSVKILSVSQQLLFTGSAAALTRLSILLKKLDTKALSVATSGKNVYIYKLKHHTASELISQLKSIATQSKKVNGITDLYKALESVRYVKNTNTLVFVGSDHSLKKISELLMEIDQVGVGKMAAKDRNVEGYQIYVPQFATGQELIQMVTSFEAHLVNSGMTNEALSEVIDHLSYVKKTNTIIVSGEKEAVLEVIGLLKQFDNVDGTADGSNQIIETVKEQGFLLYKIQNVDGNEVVGALRKISSTLQGQSNNGKINKELISAIATIQWIETTNSLIASGTPPILSKLEQLLKSVDRPLRQVFIEVLVINTTITDNTQFGLSWQNKGTIEDKFGYSFGNLQPESTSPAIPFATNLNGIDETKSASGKSIPPLAGGYMGIIGDIIFHNGRSYSSLGSLVNALKVEGDSTIVLSQKIVAQDNKNAKIFSGQNVPFTGSLVTTSGLTQTSNANLEYRNIGVTLSITPNISADGMITLDIDEEISQEQNTGSSGSTDIDTRTINGIRTSKTNMTTRIRVPDRHFLILSGTMSNTVDRKVAGIPCLGGLPLIGAAFSDSEKQITTSNIIMFVKPHIIFNGENYSEITRNQETIFGSDNQCNLQDFADGLELVRSPDDYDDSDFDEDYDE